MDIRYLDHKSIDKLQWDRTVKQSTNGHVYALSTYLDIMADHWAALVTPGYEYIMPLPYRKKFGIKYIYPPFLTGQLGVIGHAVTASTTHAFLDTIPASFKLVDLNLNADNIVQELKHSIRTNYILSLDNNLETVRSNYNENTLRNIRKSVNSKLTSRKSVSIERIIALAVKQMELQGQQVNDNIERFRKLYFTLAGMGMTETYGMYNAEERLVASAVFFVTEKRACYILVGNDSAGKNTGASHALIDAFICDHADSPLILDFEGSDIPGLARFYEGFGAIPEKYPSLRINRLPFWLRWLKK